MIAGQRAQQQVGKLLADRLAQASDCDRRLVVRQARAVVEDPG
jgi:hypothetical protein